MVPIEKSSPYYYSIFIRTTDLSCTVWPQYTTRQTDRQSDWNKNLSPINCHSTNSLRLDELLTIRYAAFLFISVALSYKILAEPSGEYERDGSPSERERKMFMGPIRDDYDVDKKSIRIIKRGDEKRSIRIIDV